MYAGVDPIVIEVIWGFPIYLVLEIIIRRIGYPSKDEPESGVFFPRMEEGKRMDDVA
jgi:hypothetical protein